jgi:hypothetical protein
MSLDTLASSGQHKHALSEREKPQLAELGTVCS